MKPIIGIMLLWDDEKESIWMLPGYLEGIRLAGGIPMIFPLMTEAEDLKRLAAMCDGFLFTGGHDVSPELYGRLPVNSYHHQGIKALASSLSAMAVSEDGLVEALYMPGASISLGSSVASGIFLEDGRKQQETVPGFCGSLRKGVKDVYSGNAALKRPAERKTEKRCPRP